MIKKILVSQPRPTSEKSPYFDIAERFGVELVFRPFIKVEGLTAREFRTQKVSILDYTAIVFTSRHAIDHFFTLAKELRCNIPEDMKYFCVTETIALYIQKYVQYRKRKVFFGTTGRVDDLLPTMVKHKTERYLVPMSDVHNDSLTTLLDSKKLVHKECVMYKTVSNDFTEEEVKNFDYDMLVFFSPSGIESLMKNFPNFDQGKIAIATFGPATAKAAQEAIKNNGDIKVDFYKEQEIRPFVSYNPTSITYQPHIFGDYSAGDFVMNARLDDGCANNLADVQTCLTAAVNACDIQCKAETTARKMETGRVEHGGHSDQSFNQVYQEFELFPYHSEEVKILPMSQKPVRPDDLKRRFCPYCGKKIKEGFIYCPNCGKKL